MPEIKEKNIKEVQAFRRGIPIDSKVAREIFMDLGMRDPHAWPNITEQEEKLETLALWALAFAPPKKVVEIFKQIEQSHAEARRCPDCLTKLWKNADKKNRYHCERCNKNMTMD